MLTVGRGDKAAYSSSNNVELLLRASARCIAPVAQMLLEDKLQTRIDQTRQRVLTVGRGDEAACLSSAMLVLLRASADASRRLHQCCCCTNCKQVIKCVNGCDSRERCAAAYSAPTMLNCA